MSKLIHAERFENAVGSRARIAVREIPTVDGPAREVEVVTNAIYTVAEARQLIAALERAVAVADSEDQPTPRPVCAVCVDCADLPAHARPALVPLVTVPGTDLRVCLPHAGRRHCDHGYTLADSCPICD